MGKLLQYKFSFFTHLMKLIRLLNKESVTDFFRKDIKK